MSGTVGDNTARASGVIAAAGGGKLLQVGSAVLTSTQTITSTSGTDITNLSVAITPSSASSKLWVTGMVCINRYYDVCFIKLQRDIGGAGYADSAFIGDAAGSRARCIQWLPTPDYQALVAQFNYLDSTNTTSEVTYKAVGWCHAGAYPLYINRTRGDSDNDSNGRGASSITVMEIGA